MKKKAPPHSYNRIAFAILGFVLGLIFIAIGVVSTLINQGIAIEAVGAVQVLSSTPLLWILLTLPLLFAFVFGWSGGRVDELNTLRSRFRKYGQNASAENRLLKSSIEEIEQKNKQAKISLEALGEATSLQGEDLRGLEGELVSLQSLQAVLFGQHPLAAVQLDLEQVILDCNPAFCELFGYPRSEIVGEYLDDLICPPELSAEARGFSETVLNGERLHAFSQRRTMDGQRLETEIFGLPVRQAGEIRSILAIYRDINKPFSLPALSEPEISEPEAVLGAVDFEPLWLPDDSLVEDEVDIFAAGDFQNQVPADANLIPEESDLAPIDPFSRDQPEIIEFEDQAAEHLYLGVAAEEAGLEQVVEIGMTWKDIEGEPDLDTPEIDLPIAPESEAELDTPEIDPPEAPKSEAES